MINQDVLGGVLRHRSFPGGIPETKPANGNPWKMLWFRWNFPTWDGKFSGAFAVWGGYPHQISSMRQVVCSSCLVCSHLKNGWRMGKKMVRTKRLNNYLQKITLPLDYSNTLVRLAFFSPQKRRNTEIHHCFLPNCSPNVNLYGSFTFLLGDSCGHIPKAHLFYQLLGVYIAWRDSAVAMGALQVWTRPGYIPWAC